MTSVYDATNLLSVIRHCAEVWNNNALPVEEVEAWYTGDKSTPLIEQICSLPEVVITPEGLVLPMETYCRGDITQKIAACTSAAKESADTRVKNKYLAQIAALSSCTLSALPQDIAFSLKQKWIPVEFILDFLNQQGFSGRYNNDKFTVYGSQSYDRFPEQLENYLNGKTVRGSSKSARFGHLSRIENLEERFNNWVQQHPEQFTLVELFKERYLSYCSGSFDPFPLDMQDFFSGNMILHGYQNSEVRRLAHEGRGICAFDVGLGKSCISLALAAWNHKKGIFPRTCIVVPNPVLVNWYNEAQRLFSPDFLNTNVFFVGLDKDKKGEPVVRPGRNNVKKDMNEAINSRYPIVVMTREKFASIRVGRPLTDQFTAASSLVNLSVARLLEQIDENREDGPLFADFNFSSVHFDEMHVWRNCLEADSRSKAIRYLPTPTIAKTSLDAAVKSFAITKKNAGKGVYGFTATPLTNSPFEVINMISMVSAPNELEELCITSMHDFVEFFGNVKLVPHVGIAGTVEMQQGLVGFTNLEALRNFYSRYVHIKEATEVKNAFKVVEPDEHEEFVALNQDQAHEYQNLRNRANSLGTGGSEFIFSIIRDMDRLTISCDYYHRKITYFCKSEHKQSLENAVLLLPGQFPTATYCTNEKKWIVTDMPLAPAITDTTDSRGNRMCSLTLPCGIDPVIGKACRDVGIEEGDLTHPLTPKYERLLEKVKKHHAAGGKQLVFTDDKEQHALLRRIISYELSIPLGQIGIINASEANGDKLDRLCQAYNSGKVNIIIANRKAELGINLQQGTSAIHHLTLPWAPSSIKQRNGRGIRQGNTVSQIDVYYYYAKETFDSYRHKLLRIKENWISELITGKLPAMPNGDVLTTEELLDMLASDPEAAAKNREKRQAAAAIVEKRERDRSLFVALNQLACLHTTTRRKRQQIIQLAKKVQREITVCEQRLAKENSRQVTFMETVAMPKSTSEADSQNPEVEIEELKNKQQELEAMSIGVEAQFVAKHQQLSGFLREMGCRGELPFDAGLIDKAETLIATPEGRIFFVGEIWESPAPTPAGIKFCQIIQTNPVKKMMLVRILSPEGSDKTAKMGVADMSKFSKIAHSDYMLKEKWRYGLMHKNGFLDRDFFELHADWMQYNYDYGLVYKTEDTFSAVWSKGQKPPAGARLVWPEPDNPGFRQALFQQYIQDKNSPGFSPNLMLDLFGDDYDMRALASVPSPEADFMRVMSGALEAARQSGLFGGLSPEDLLRKVEAFSAAQLSDSSAGTGTEGEE